MKSIVFDLDNVAKRLIHQVNPLIGKGKSGIAFMAKRNILIGIEADLVQSCHMNCGIVFEEGGKMGDVTHLAFQELDMGSHGCQMIEMGQGQFYNFSNIENIFRPS